MLSVQYIGYSPDHQAVKTLKKYGFAKLEADFASIYAHTLVEFGKECQPPPLVYLFAVAPVKEAFKSDLYKNTDAFHRILESELHTNRKLPQELKQIPHLRTIQKEIATFCEQFDYLSYQTASPISLKMHNRTYEKLLELLETNEKNSFEYQAKAYLEERRKEFQQDFLDDNLYVPIKAEKRELFVHLSENSLDLLELQNTTNQYKQKITKTPLGIIDERINDWLKDEKSNFLVIMGEYGTGKTTLMRYLLHQLACQNLEPDQALTITDPKNRIPILLPLMKFEKSIENMVTSVCNNNYGIKDLTFNDFRQKANKGELIVIFDGFDETTQNIDTDEKKRNITQIANIVSKDSKAKLIITCREEYFKSYPDLLELFTSVSIVPDSIIYLKTFDEEQIRQFLQRTNQVDFYFDKIKKIFDLHDLAKRPVLLELIVKYLPAIIKTKQKDDQIKASELYERSIQDELDRKEKELPFKIKGKYRLEILKKIACWMYENDTLSFNTNLLESDLNLLQHFKSTVKWEQEKQLNEFLTFTFLIRDGSNFQYRISHKSFRDYLTATVWTDEINTGNLKYFAKTEATKELRTFILEQNPDKKQLLKLTETAKNLIEETQWQGTNALNLLLAIDKNAIAGKNLANCYFKNVVLFEPSNNLTSTNKKPTEKMSTLIMKNNPNLKGTVFYETQFINCTLGQNILDAASIEGGVFQDSSLYLLTLKLDNLDRLERFKNISSLNINHISNDEMSILNHFKNLKTLKLGCHDDVIDLSEISKLTSITSLSLISRQLNELNHLNTLKDLDNLFLFCIESLELKGLKNFKKLRSLWIVAFKQTIDLSELKHSDNLESLSIISESIKELKTINSLKNLKFLYFFDCKIPNLNVLSELRSLQKMVIVKSKFNKKQLEKLKAKLPNLEVWIS